MRQFFHRRTFCVLAACGILAALLTACESNPGDLARPAPAADSSVSSLPIAGETGLLLSENPQPPDPVAIETVIIAMRRSNAWDTL